MSISSPSPNAAAEIFLPRLAQIVGDAHLSIDPADLESYGRDWTKVFAPHPLAIVFPRTTEEVQRIVQLAREMKVAIVPSGGRTGLSAGAVATNGELVVSTKRMRDMGVVDLRGATLRVQAGVITQEVHEYVKEHRLTWPVDFASKGSSAVGGNIATNAGGVRVIRYGLTRQWVLGLTVVTGAGEVLEIGGPLEKNNTGYDLKHMFIGSEGTLGIVTEATLKLCALPEKTEVLLFAVEGLAGVLRLFDEAKRAPFTISAFEFFTDRCLRRVQMHRKLQNPLAAETDHFVLLEVEHANYEALLTWVESLVDRNLVQDGTLADSSSRAHSLWELRESISESLSATGFPHKNDISLPIAALEDFTRELHDVFEKDWPGFEICLFGHIGDGNLHVNVMKPDNMDKDEFVKHAHEADQATLGLVRKFGGSISAEHGIGLLKKDWLGYTRSEGELAIFRALKDVFDPDGIMNPGKIFDRK